MRLIDDVEETMSALCSSADLLAIQSKIHMLERQRNHLLYQASKESSTEDLALLRDYFRDVDTLGFELGTRVFQVLHNALYFAAVMPEVLVAALRYS